jgi:hypothetical protein
MSDAIRNGEGAAQHPAPARGHVRISALLFGFFGGPAAWTVQTLVNLPLTSHACFPQLEPVSTPVFGDVRGVAFALSLAAVLTCAAATLVSWKTWSKTRAEHQGSTGAGTSHAQSAALLETGEGRTRFMAASGLMLSTVFLLVTIVSTITIFIVSPCGFQG